MQLRGQEAEKDKQREFGESEVGHRRHDESDGKQEPPSPSWRQDRGEKSPRRNVET